MTLIDPETAPTARFRPQWAMTYRKTEDWTPRTGQRGRGESLLNRGSPSDGNSENRALVVNDNRRCYPRRKFPHVWEVWFGNSLARGLTRAHPRFRPLPGTGRGTISRQSRARWNAALIRPPGDSKPINGRLSLDRRRGGGLRSDRVSGVPGVDPRLYPLGIYRSLFDISKISKDRI